MDNTVDSTLVHYSRTRFGGLNFTVVGEVSMSHLLFFNHGQHER